MSNNPSNRLHRQPADPRPPGPLTIERCVAAWQRITHALQADDELVSDEQTLVAMLEADPSILTPDELLRRFIAAIAFAEAREAEAHTFAAAMKAREHRYAGRVMAMRTELMEIMQALDRRSFSGSPFGNASFREGRQTAVVLDADKLPDRFWKWSRTLKQADLTTALHDGEVIDGAVLSNPMPVLVLRLAKSRPAGADDEGES